MRKSSRAEARKDMKTMRGEEEGSQEVRDVEAQQGQAGMTTGNHCIYGQSTLRIQ